MFTLTAASLAGLVIKIAGSGGVVIGGSKIVAWFFDAKGGKQNASRSKQNRSPRERAHGSAPVQRIERQQPSAEEM